jgi:hypothetical protein
MEERISLVFTWNPLARYWVNERGGDQASAPPAEPIDNETVQTYFLDPQTGRWTGTILGSSGREIAAQLGTNYRSALAVGLAFAQTERARKHVPIKVWLAGVLAVIAAAYFAQAPTLPMFQ